MTVDRVAAKDGATRSRSPAVSRAASVLSRVAEASAPARLSSIARSIGAAKSTTLNVCEALVVDGLLRRVDGGYVLGSRILELANAYLDGLDEVAEFHEVCMSVAPDLGETIHLGILSDGLEITYVARREGRAAAPIVSRIGQPLPASCTATGKAALAELPEEDLRLRIEANGGLPVHTENSISTYKALQEELALTRERGYAIDRGEANLHLYCVGIYVPGRDGGRRWAVGVTLINVPGVGERLPSILEVLRPVAAKLGERMAGRRP